MLAYSFSIPGKTPPLRSSHWQFIDRRARIVPGLFSRQECVTAAEMARALGLSSRPVRDLVGGWLVDGWLILADPVRRSRRYH